MRLLLALACALAAIPAASAQPWSPDPWIADLAQMRAAMESGYANLEWLRDDREVVLDTAFDRVATRLRTARSDAEARAVLDRLVQRIGDGHVAIEWPRDPAPAPVAKAGPSDVCRDMGYASQSAPAFVDRMAGYRALPDDGVFPAGLVPVEGRSVGALRIGYFDPKGSPSLCRAALAALRIPAEAPCDDTCRDEVLTWTYQRFTTALEERVRALEAAGAVALMIDLTGNGGGSDWVETAVRIVSPRPLKSAAVGFVRGPHWAQQWERLAATLRDAAKTAKRADRPRLLAWAAEADKARVEAGTPCAPGTGCTRLGRAGYATGLVGDARAGDFDGKPWAVHVFNPAQFAYHDSVWQRPLMVLVDNETWSAAEQFAAMLQDNRAAVIVGARTGGAGCGYTWGGTPVTLTNSRAVLKLPDCVRFRADGSNEVAGVIPDVLTGMRYSDGATRKARMTEAALPTALREAEAQR